MPYHWRIPRGLRAEYYENTSHCYEGALFAAAALRANGYPPLVVDLEAEHDTDHVIAVYSVGRSLGRGREIELHGCRYREPVYRSLRELALSYFDVYFNLRGERSLRTFSRPVAHEALRSPELDDFREARMVCGRIFADNSHTPLISRAQAKRLHRLDGRSFRAGCLERAEK